MNVNLAPGKYVAAVSGGVDSVVLLDILAKQSGLDLVVAHFDHGIRADSSDDRLFVQKLAEAYKLKFLYGQGNLGPNASEAVARSARYEFLRQIQQEQSAKAIVTAHHQDDLIETALINLWRGTGRKGLTALKSTIEIKRPLLDYPKTDLINYAKAHNLQWREDSTNQQTDYLRNYLRLKLIPKMSVDDRHSLLNIITNTRQLNVEIDEILNEMLEVHNRGNALDRNWFVVLPHAVAREVMASWLRRHDLAGFDRHLIERLVVQAKTLPPGKQISVLGSVKIMVKAKHLALE
jgi:tRNA(Ile)-lysidine synthetase-like protein